MSQSCRSIKKPGGSNQNNQVDQCSSYTGKSFYETPKEQEETKKLINRNQFAYAGTTAIKYIIRRGVRTPVRQQVKSTQNSGKQDSGRPISYKSHCEQNTISSNNLPFKYTQRTSNLQQEPQKASETTATATDGVDNSGSFLPFEQRPSLITPIPKPSIGA